MYLTNNMRAVLRQVCSGTKYVDVRSAAALARRGLATPARREDGGLIYHSYVPTEQGLFRIAQEDARRLVDQYQAEKGHWFVPDKDAHATLRGFALWMLERDA